MNIGNNFSKLSTRKVYSLITKQDMHDDEVDEQDTLVSK